MQGKPKTSFQTGVPLYLTQKSWKPFQDSHFEVSNSPKEGHKGSRQQ